MNNLYNAKNERIKYDYAIYLSNAKQRDRKTVMSIMKHLHIYETYRNFADFSIIDKKVIHNYVEKSLKENKSLSYIDHNLSTIREFYSWLERQRGYKSKINYNILAYFSLTKNQRKEARATEYQRSYKRKDIVRAIRSMPENSMEARRNKAMISMQYFCGLRISELRTVKVKSIIFDEDSENWMVYVSPKDMNVKFAKTRCAFFMPFDEDITENVFRWRQELIKLGFKSKDPLFPSIQNQFNQCNLLEENIKKGEIKSNTTIREIFKRAFTSQGLEYLRPHSFRHTIARWAERQSPEFFNAVSQSLGHSHIETTFTSYGALRPIEIGRILKKKVEEEKQ